MSKQPQQISAPYAWIIEAPLSRITVRKIASTTSSPLWTGRASLRQRHPCEYCTFVKSTYLHNIAKISILDIQCCLRHALCTHMQNVKPLNFTVRLHKNKMKGFISQGISQAVTSHNEPGNIPKIPYP